MNRHLKDYLLLLKYRVYSAFHNWRVWTLFLLSILFTCMNMASFVFSNETYKDVSNNICYGYIAGFIFYLLNEFRTSTKQEFEDMAFISRAFHFILQNIDDLERQIMRGHAKPEDYNDCEQLLKESSITERIVITENGIDKNYVVLKEDKKQLIRQKSKYLVEEIYYLIHTMDKYVTPYVWELLRSFSSLISMETSMVYYDKEIYPEIDIDCLFACMQDIKRNLTYVNDKLKKYEFVNYL